MLLRIFILTIIYSAQTWGQGLPKSDDDKIGINLGVESGMTITKFEGSPLGLPRSEMTPPMMTFKLEYRPDYSIKFQPDLHLALAILRGGGQYLHLQSGGWMDFPNFHLFFGGEVFSTLSGGNYDETIVDHFGFGFYLKGGVPLDIFYPEFEIRYREIKEAEVANQEGLTTYIRHDGDVIVRPSLTVDLSLLKLWGALTYYQVGNTAIASKDFGLGIKGSSFTVTSIGVGFELVDAEIWVKAHRIDGVQDELAHFYQTPQVYPDFLIAKESAFLEVLWRF